MRHHPCNRAIPDEEGTERGKKFICANLSRCNRAIPDEEGTERGYCQWYELHACLW